MKYALPILLLAATCCRALTLEWDAPTGATQYTVWLRTSNGPVVIATTTNTSMVVTNSRRDILGVSAVGTNGFESEIAWGLQPQPIRIRLTIQSSDSPAGPWKDVAETAMIATIPATGFVRGRMDIQ